MPYHISYGDMAQSDHANQQYSKDLILTEILFVQKLKQNTTSQNNSPTSYKATQNFFT